VGRRPPRLRCLATGRRAAACLLLGTFILALGGADRALAGGPPAASARPFERAPDPATHPGPDADLFVKALGLQRRRQWIAARRVFWKLLDAYPDSPYAPEAEDRSGPDAFLGIWPMGPIGPCARRIDVALMGDGYRLRRQDRFEKHCAGELEALLREPLYQVYRPYFNFWQVNLASRDKGVDEPDPPEPDAEMQERLRHHRRARRPGRQYDTALDCKAAGPQGQVCANPRRVRHYLRYLDANDDLAIVFAQMGRLGMGGAGIATTGPRGVIVHEFGHAFIGLLDEYAIYPGPPSGQVSGPNTTTDPAHPPWQHFLDAKVKGVGVYEGGATFQTGVWRPAQSCAMNTGGSAPYCPVCREQGVLRIYERVSPIDQVWPAEHEVAGTTGRHAQALAFRVLPMQPVGEELQVAWILGPAPQVTEPAPPASTPDADGPGDERLDPFEARLRRKRGLDAKQRDAAAARRRALAAGARHALMRVRGTAHDPRPPGRELRGRRRHVKDLGLVHDVTLPPDLAPGRWRLTAIVRDPAKPRGARVPWVLKDDRGLLEDRFAWTITLRAADDAGK
jgi:hypothetical protein